MKFNSKILKIATLCIFLSAIPCLNVFSLDPPRILEIRKIYQAAGRGITGGAFQETRIVLDVKTLETGHIYWMFDQRVPEGDSGVIVMAVKEQDLRSHTSYIEYLYNRGNQLVFVFERLKLKDTDRTRERRFYLAGGKLIRYIRTIEGKANIADTGLEIFQTELVPFFNDARNLASLLSESIAPMVSDISKNRQPPQARRCVGAILLFPKTAAPILRLNPIPALPSIQPVLPVWFPDIRKSPVLGPTVIRPGRQLMF